MRQHFDVVVVGGGPAGVAAALAISKRKTVALVDEHGTCSKPAINAEMTKAFVQATAAGADFAAAAEQAVAAGQAYRQTKPRKRSLQAAGVAVFTGRAEFVDLNAIQIDHDQFKAKYFVIATGSKPGLPDFPGAKFLGRPDDIFSLAHKPKRIILIDPGDTTQALAKALETLGSKVTIINQSSVTVIGSVERLQRSLRLNYLDRVAPRSLSAELILATGQVAPNLDLNLDAAEVRYETDGIMIDRGFRTTNKHIFAAGSCLVPGQCRYSPATQGSMVAKALARPWF